MCVYVGVGDEKQENKYLHSHAKLNDVVIGNDMSIVKTLYEKKEEEVERMNVWILLFQFQYLFFPTENERNKQEAQQQSLVSKSCAWWIDNSF